MDDYNVANEWLKFAQRDYDIALHLSKTFFPLPTENICYNCQQAIEKALKATLIYLAGDYPKTHDIRELHQLCKESGVDFGLVPSITRTLTRYATKSRYPDDVYDFTDKDAEIAIEYAEQLLNNARESLNKAQKEAEQAEASKEEVVEEAQ